MWQIINLPIAQMNELIAKLLHHVSLRILSSFSFVFALLICQFNIYFVDFSYMESPISVCYVNMYDSR